MERVLLDIELLDTFSGMIYLESYISFYHPYLYSNGKKYYNQVNMFIKDIATTVKLFYMYNAISYFIPNVYRSGSTEQILIGFTTVIM